MGVLLKAFGRNAFGATPDITCRLGHVIHRGLHFRIFNHQFPKRRVILPGQRRSEILISQHAEYQDKREKDCYRVKREFQERIPQAGRNKARTKLILNVREE